MKREHCGLQFDMEPRSDAGKVLAIREKTTEVRGARGAISFHILFSICIFEELR